jgi:hypothetical protein
MPNNPATNAFLLRRWEGINRAVDPALLSPSFLRVAKNWIPSLAGRLRRRPGTLPYLAATPATTIKAIKALRTDTGFQHLYIIETVMGVDMLAVSIDGSPFVTVSGAAAFATLAPLYFLVEFRGVLYAGNGTDPIKRLVPDSDAVDLITPTAVTDTSAAPTIIEDPGSAILTGGYSYCWGLYNSTTRQWRARSQARFVTNILAKDRAIVFPVPIGFDAVVPDMDDRLHLFVSPVNLPVEFAHTQTPEGVDAGGGGGGVAGPITLRTITADGIPIPMRGVTRNGTRAVFHREAMWLVNGRDVLSTAVIPFFREEDIYNHGDIFPANAIARFPDIVTNMGVAAATSRDDPRSPMCICTASATWLWYGDLFDDPGAERIQVSDEIGCVGPFAMVSTPLGLFFLGHRSVYVVPPGGGAPVDVGWPIEDDIRTIPRGRRASAQMYYHKGFIKLDMAGPGQITNTRAFWLDLRRGLGTPPSWWGPHDTGNYTAVTRTLTDPSEDDRAYAAVENRVVILHQLTTTLEDGIGVGGVGETHELDGGQPFHFSLLTRVLAAGITPAPTTLEICVFVDGATAPICLTPDLTFQPGLGSWDGLWNGTWGISANSHGEVLPDEPRLRGFAFSFRFTHRDDIALELRDLEARFEAIERPVRDYLET